MRRFTIRDLLWLTVVVGLSLVCVIEHRKLSEAKKARLTAETGWQISVVEHNKTLRLLEVNGLMTVGHSDGTTTLEKTSRSSAAGGIFN